MQQPPSNPNQPSQGESSFWGNTQSPQQGQPFNPQFPSGQYPPQQGQIQQQGYQQFPQGYPQQYQQPPMSPASTLPKKKSRKGLIIGAIVLVVALALCGAIGSAFSHSATAVTSTTASSGKIGNSTGTTPTAIPTQASNYKVGDVVNVGNAWDVTVISAKADPGNTIFQPKSGMQYLVLNLAMKNLTTENHTISSLIQFTLRSDDGTKYNVALYAPDGSSQIDGDVDGGQPAKGVISYEVPTNVHSFHLTFENVVSSGRATWNLTI